MYFVAEAGTPLLLQMMMQVDHVIRWLLLLLLPVKTL